MASKQGIYAAFKVLSRAFAGTVDAEKVDLYHAALEDLSDEAIATATVKVVKEWTGQFIPPPALIRNAVGANATPVIDVDSIRYHIEKLGEYNPNVGWIYPSNQKVQAILGESIAVAYAIAGKALFSENETTASIATREFREALETEVRHSGMAAIALPEKPKQLTEGA